MSRPGYRKPPQERRDLLVRVRLTAAEAAQLKGRADLAGVTLSDLVRTSALTGRAPRARPGRIQSEALHALNRVGVNLNQLTRLANTGLLDPVLARDLLHLLDTLEEVMKRVVEP